MTFRTEMKIDFKFGFENEIKNNPWNEKLKWKSIWNLHLKRNQKWFLKVKVVRLYRKFLWMSWATILVLEITLFRRLWRNGSDF